MLEIKIAYLLIITLTSTLGGMIWKDGDSEVERKTVETQIVNGRLTIEEAKVLCAHYYKEFKPLSVIVSCKVYPVDLEKPFITLR